MINVKEIVQKWKEEIKGKINDDTLPLVIYQIGDNVASNIYIKNKIKDCEEVGITVELRWFPESIDFITVYNNLVDTIEHYKYNIMVQLPTPFTKEEERILLDLIPMRYDPDGLSSESILNGKLPCTPKGIMELFNRLNTNLDGKHVVVINRSKIVGKPLIEPLINANATITVCHSHTHKYKLKKLCQMADIIIVGVGIPNFITKDMVDKSTMIIDVGINRDENGKVCGDCDRELYKYVDMITPVPNGVGLLTRCALLDSIK